MNSIVLLELIVWSLLLASFLAWRSIAARWGSGEPLLDYTARREVPWGAIHLLVFWLLFSTVHAAIGALAGIDAGLTAEDLPIGDRIRQTVVLSVAGLLSVALGMVLIRRLTGASYGDLGLDFSRHAAVSDLKAGAVAFLAITPPVYAIKAVLVKAEEWYDRAPPLHPLVRMLEDQPPWSAIAAAITVAVVVAPITEEFMFRLLLQGWLERVMPNMRRSAAPTDENPLVADRLAMVPIAISSAIFAVLHKDHGLDPIPLFFLALVLGYLYQRTHRLLPSVVLHAMFNAFSLSILPLQLAGRQAG